MRLFASPGDARLLAPSSAPVAGSLARSSSPSDDSRRAQDCSQCLVDRLGSGKGVGDFRLECHQCRPLEATRVLAANTWPQGREVILRTKVIRQPPVILLHKRGAHCAWPIELRLAEWLLRGRCEPPPGYAPLRSGQR